MLLINIFYITIEQRLELKIRACKNSFFESRFFFFCYPVICKLAKLFSISKNNFWEIFCYNIIVNNKPEEHI